jgi:hypothetical protein
MNTLRYGDTSFVAVGAWNPAIIQPNWLHKEFPKIITDANAPILIMPGGMASGFRLEYNNFSIEVSGARLVFMPRYFEISAFQLIKSLALGIHEKLYHTPIVAAGNNFAFELKGNEMFRLNEFEKEEDIRNLYSFNGGYSFVAKTTCHTIANKDCKININYISNNILSLNFDYSSPAISAPMETAAGKLEEDFHEANNIKNLLVKGV